LPEADSIDRVQCDADGAGFPVHELEDVEVDLVGTDQSLLDLRDLTDSVSWMNRFVAYAKAHEITLLRVKNDENPRRERGQKTIRRWACKQLHARDLYSKTRPKSQ
jgi:hypothetical protein